MYLHTLIFVVENFDQIRPHYPKQKRKA